MKYLCIADLHLDFWEDDKRNPFEGCEEALEDLDLLIIAGDLSNKPQKRWTRLLTPLVDLVGSGKVKIFPGNHDFYQYRFDAEDRLSEFADAAGAEYVNRKVVELEDTRFICATLWTDMELGPGRTRNIHHIPTRMNDYRAIRHAGAGYRRLWPEETIRTHKNDLDFIAGELAKPFAGRSIVVTHHAPHPDVLNDYKEDLDAAYASDLSAFIKTNKPDAWSFGHCHDARSITVEGCSLENVSLGYPDDVLAPKERFLSLIKDTELRLSPRP